MIVREAGSGTREVIDRALAKRGQTLKRPPMVLGSTEAIKRAVAAGLGVAIVSHLTIQTEVASGQLAILPLRGFLLFCLVRSASDFSFVSAALRPPYNGIALSRVSGFSRNFDTPCEKSFPERLNCLLNILCAFKDNFHVSTIS
jgi:hypothetical protein